MFKADKYNSVNKVRQHALEIFQATLAAANPFAAIFYHVEISADVLRVGGHGFKLSDFEHVYVVGAGKAVALIAFVASEDILLAREPV